MRRFFLILGIVIVYFSCIKVYASSEIVMETSTKRVLHEENSKEKRLIASTTKIMTAILTIEYGNLTDVIEVGPEILTMYGTNIYLEVGEKITVVDLLYGLILRSGNDAAVVLAKYIAGNEDKFVELMNKKAKEIGMLDTEFQNSHGLDEKNRNISTAYDMALLSIYAYNNDTYKKISGTKIYKTNTNKKSYAWYNRNSLLSTYQYCTSGKNGYTPSAGKTLVTTASKNGMNLTIVTLNVYDSYSVHRKLYEKYYETYEMTEIIKKGEYFIPNDYYDGKLKIVKSFYYPLTKQEKENVKTELYISKEATQKKINYVEIKLGDKKIGKIEVQNIKKKEDNNIFEKIKNYLLEILNKLMLGLQNNLNPAPLVPRPLEIYSFVSSS